MEKVTGVLNARNVVIFGVHNSSLSHIDNSKNIFFSIRRWPS